MSCNENKHHGSSHCVVDVVKFINELQDCSTTTCGSGCEIPFLGAHNSASVANTRPFILYTQKLENLLKHLHQLQAFQAADLQFSVWKV